MRTSFSGDSALILSHLQGGRLAGAATDGIYWPVVVRATNGGSLVIGADDHGRPSGEMDAAGRLSGLSASRPAAPVAERNHA